MSRYAWLACEDCKKYIWLGKEINKNDMTYFHIGDESNKPNSEQTEFCKMIFKFLAEHIGHTLRVLDEGMFDSLDDEDYIEIGETDESIIDYIKMFEG